MVKKSIEEKYKEMDEISHILHRPSMYVGSIKEETNQTFIYNKDSYVGRNAENRQGDAWRRHSYSA